MRHDKEGYLYWEIARRCDRIIAEIQANPPGLTGWLNGGIDRERMLKLKAELEAVAVAPKSGNSFQVSLTPRAAMIPH